MPRFPVQGRIAACNVLSDLYANAVTEIDTVLMALAVGVDMAPSDRDIVTAHMIRGFTDVVRDAGASVTGGQTIFNPSPIIGGIASRCAPLATCGGLITSVSRLPPLQRAARAGLHPP